MIIDCHVHLNNYREQVAVSLDESLAKLQVAMAEAGVVYALVLTSYLVNANRPSVAQVVKEVEKAPNVGVVAGISYASYKERDLREPDAARPAPGGHVGSRSDDTLGPGV